MARLLLHLCCAPCAAWSVPALRGEGFLVSGRFHNPNVHPEEERRRRAEALAAYAPTLGIEVSFSTAENPEEHQRALAAAGPDRCRVCYRLRLGAVAREAARLGADAFSTSLLYSVHQKHELVREAGEEAGREAKVPFLYRDLRPGWEEGRRRYRETGLYRQNYCGCAFSEQERQERRARRAAAGRRP